MIEALLPPFLIAAMADFRFPRTSLALLSGGADCGGGGCVAVFSFRDTDVISKAFSTLCLQR